MSKYISAEFGHSGSIWYVTIKTIEGRLFMIWTPKWQEATPLAERDNYDAALAFIRRSPRVRNLRIATIGN